MPAPANVAEFLDLVRKSGVLEEPRLAAFLTPLEAKKGIPPEPSKLAGLMVQEGLLTYFQADQFLQGKWKRFTIGKYKVLERLGSGGMGQVFLCEHKLMHRRVAVKVLPTAKAEDPSSLERFYREARAVAALDHPNIVRAYDIDQDDNLHFLVLEYVDGSSLQDIIKKHGKMDYIRACHYIRDAAIGLDHAHHSGLIHRDVKPGNILLDRQGLVKILDMGLARFFNDEEDNLTRKYDENVLGTADYLAPEQAMDSHTVDGRADIYSLGATFYYLLTGHPPFTDGTVAQKLVWHQQKDPKPIQSIRQDVPQEVIAIVRKMMAKKPENRFQTPADVVIALDKWTATPIDPPPEKEMPQLCAAITSTTTGGSGISPTIRTTSNSTSSTAVPLPPRATLKTSSRPPSTNSPNKTNPTKPVVSSPPVASNPSGSVNEVETAKRLPKTNSPVVEPIASQDGQPVWEAMTVETHPPSRVQTKSTTPSKSTTTNSAKKDPTGKPQLKIDPKIWLWVIAVVILIAAVIVVIKLLPSSSSSRSNAEPPGPRRLLVSKHPGPDRFNTIREAMERVKSGDHIVIMDDEWEEVLIDPQIPRDVVVEADEGKRVVWKIPAGFASPYTILSLRNPENVRLRGITFNANNLSDFALRISGKCAGLIIEDVSLLEARKTPLVLTNCSGEEERPIVLKKLRIVGSSKATSEVGIHLAGIVSGNQVNRVENVHIRNCRIEGIFKHALQLDGTMQGIIIKNNRIWNVANGLFVKKLIPDQQSFQVDLIGNTFHTIHQHAIHWESTSKLSDSVYKGRFQLEIRQNYFSDVTSMLRADDNRPFGHVLVFSDNARSATTKENQPILCSKEIDVPLSTKPEDKSFLFFPPNSPLTKAANGNPIGAPQE